MTQPTQLVQGVDELAQAVRRLVDATVRTTTDAATLRELTQTVDRVTETLQTQVRTGRWVPDRSDPQASPYNTVVGLATRWPHRSYSRAATPTASPPP